MSRDVVPINKRDPFWKDPFFSSSWDDFEATRQGIIAQNKDFWSNVDKGFEDFEEQVRRQHADLDRQMAPLMPSVPQWAVPEKLRDKWAPMTRSDEGEIIKVKETSDKFEVSLDVSQYKPEELKVSTVDNMLSIEGNRTEVRQEGGSSSSFSKQFSRKWTLPEDCRIDLVASNLSSDGILMVTAPKRNAIEFGGGGAKAITH